MVAQTWYFLPIKSSGQIGPSGTNMMRTNVFGGTNILVEFGTNGEATINTIAVGGMSQLASNFFKMGISNILSGGVGIALGTNNGVLWITNTSGGGGSLNIQTNSINVGTETNLNLIEGFGISLLATNIGGTNKVQFNINTITNSFQPASATLTNLNGNPYTGYTNLAVQVAANNVLSNIQGMVSFYWTNAQASSMLLSNLVNNPYTGYTNLNFQVAANNVLSNIQNMASFYWTNAQASSMILSNIVGLSDTTFTNVPLGGTNINVRIVGGTNFFDTIGNLNDWSQIPTGAMANVVSTTFLTNWANAISNYVIASTNSASVTNWINFRQLASANLTNWSMIPTGEMANVVSATFATNWANSISNLVQTKQNGSAVLTNLVGLSSTVFTNVPLGGTNISVRTTGGTNFIDTIGELNNWSQLSTNNISNLIGATNGLNIRVDNLEGSSNLFYSGEVSITNGTRIGWIYDRLTGTNRLRSMSAGNGLLNTNESTNVSYAIDPTIVASQANITSLSNAVRFIEIMTNNLSVAGGIRAGLVTNIVFKCPPWAMLATNNSGSNSVEVTFNPYPPFAVLDKTNYLFSSPDWELNFNEEFNGNISTTPSGSGIGQNYWNNATTGTAPGSVNPLFENAMAGFFSLSTTQANSGVAIVNTTSFSYSATNQEIFILTRVKMWRTNDANDQATLRLGLISSGATRTDPSDGFYLRTTTNGNNQVQIITTRSGSSTISTAAATIIQNTWTNFAIRLDASGTNIIGYIGNSSTNLVSFATNTANVSYDALLSPWFNNYKLKASAGNTGHTNSIDYMKIWVRRITP